MASRIKEVWSIESLKTSEKLEASGSTGDNKKNKIGAQSSKQLSANDIKNSISRGNSNSNKTDGSPKSANELAVVYLNHRVQEKRK